MWLINKTQRNNENVFQAMEDEKNTVLAYHSHCFRRRKYTVISTDGPYCMLRILVLDLKHHRRTMRDKRRRCLCTCTPMLHLHPVVSAAPFDCPFIRACNKWERQKGAEKKNKQKTIIACNRSDVVAVAFSVRVRTEKFSSKRTT